MPSAREIADYIAQHTACEALGRLDFEVTRPAGLDQLGVGSVSFLKRRPAGSLVFGMDSALVLVTPEATDLVIGPRIVVDNPRLAFARVVARWFANDWEIVGIHPSAQIAPGAKIGEEVRIGANCVISSSATIGDRTVLHHGVVIGPKVEIGRDCTIRSNCVIGEEGFGVEELANDETFRIPHVGGVRIGDHVNMGNLNSISAGTLGPTVIEDHVQIDNLVNIAHNGFVGAGSMIMPCVMMAGSARVGKRSYIGCNASITNGVSLGDDCQVGLGAVVIRSYGDNLVLAGNPAKVLRERR